MKTIEKLRAQLGDRGGLIDEAVISKKQFGGGSISSFIRSQLTDSPAERLSDELEETLAAVDAEEKAAAPKHPLVPADGFSEVEFI